METWVDVKGYEGFYKVSNRGNVKSMHCGKERILKQGYYKGFYPVVVLAKNGTKKTHKVHSIVAKNFLGDCPKGFEIAHLDGDKNNNNVENLKYCSCSENNMHKHLHGKMPCGQKAYNAKLTDDYVVYIRKNKDKHTQKYFGKMFGVDQSIISRALRGENWKHV